MPWGGARPGAGRPKGRKPRKPKSQDLVIKEDAAWEVPIDRRLPLEIMIEMANDPRLDPSLRLRAAAFAAPFVHPRMSDVRIGKADADREKAEETAKANKFGAMTAAPKLIVNN